MSTSTVPIFDPQGTLRDVPQDQLAAAVKAGGMPAVRFQAPDKSIRFVPANRTTDAVRAGGQILPIEQQDVQHPGFWSTLYDDVKGMAQGTLKTAAAGAQAIAGNPLPAATQLSDTAQMMGENMQHRRDEGRSFAYRTIAPVGEALGVNVRGMEDAADQGNTAAVLGHAAAVPAVMAATEGAARGAGPALNVARSGIEAASPAIKNAARTAVTKIPEVAGGTVGAYVGHATGIPEGGFIGALAGRQLAKDLFSERLASALTKKPSEFTNPGAPYPETPSPELIQAQAIGKGAAAPQDPAAGLGEIPNQDVTRPSLERISDPLDRLRNQELPPEQPDYIPPRPSIERLTPKEKAAAITQAGSAQEAAPATAEPAAAPTSSASPKKLSELLNQATGGDKGKIVRGVPLKNQPTAQATPAAPAAAAEPSTASQIAASVAPKLPEGFTPVDSSVLRGYKYDADAQEFSSITNRGDHYIHGGVSPEEAEAFEAADSKGKAWNQLRSQNPLVAKVVNGNRQPYVPLTRGEIREGVEAPPGGTMRAIENALPASQAPKLAPSADVNAAIAQSGKRTIVTDPETGRPEFSDVVAAKKNAPPAASSGDLTSLLQQSVSQAQKGGVFTSAAPADLLDRWGVDEKSFLEGRSQTRGMKPDESEAAIDKLVTAYKKGQPVEPVMETRDAGNNIVDVDGRGRALAAKKAGIQRIPIIVRRLPAATSQ